MRGDSVVEPGSSQMSITKSTHCARIKIANPPNTMHEFNELYSWVETQIDTSGGRFFQALDMEVDNGYVECKLTLGWLHGKEDRLLFEAAGITVYSGEQPKKLPKNKIEIDYDKKEIGHE